MNCSHICRTITIRIESNTNTTYICYLDIKTSTLYHLIISNIKIQMGIKLLFSMILSFIFNNPFFEHKLN